MFSTPFPLGIFREGLGSGGGIGGLAGFILVVMGRVRLGTGGLGLNGRLDAGRAGPRRASTGESTRKGREDSEGIWNFRRLEV